MEKLEAFGRPVDKFLGGVGGVVYAVFWLVVGLTAFIIGLAAIEYATYAGGLIILVLASFIIIAALAKEGWKRVRGQRSTLRSSEKRFSWQIKSPSS